MKCPKCGGKMKVYDSHKLDNNGEKVGKSKKEPILTRRYRKCGICEHHMKSIEDLT